MSWTKSSFRKIKNIIPITVASTTANAVSKINSSDYGAYMDLTISMSTGNAYISTLTTTLTSTNGFYIKEGDVIDLQVPDYLAIVGDSTTSAYKAIIWDSR